MSFAGVRNAMDQYSQNAVQARVESASPHRLIQMLLEGALSLELADPNGIWERVETPQSNMHFVRFGENEYGGAGMFPLVGPE